MDEKKAVASEPTLESLPGMGPIRARALRKAGWDSITSLRKATVADLTAVPGITEIKARQLVEHLQMAQVLPAKPGRPARPPRPKPAATPVAAPAASVSVAPLVSAPPVSVDRKGGSALMALQALAIATGQAALGLLSSPPAADLDEALARQLGKMVSAVEEIAGVKKLGPKRGERAAAELRKIGESLQQISAGKLGGKQQKKLAEALREHRRKLEEAVE